MSYFYLLATSYEERELAALELWALAGVEPVGATAASVAAVDVAGAAYVRFCAQTLAQADSLEALEDQVRVQELTTDRFRLEIFRPSLVVREAQAPCREPGWERVPQGTREITLTVANALRGWPDLDHPRERLVVVAQPGRWLLGRIVSPGRRDWEGFPPSVGYSAALSAQMARALVNLVAAPGDSLLDPCCGMGTVVAQAARRGIRAVGVEIVRKLSWQAGRYVQSVGGPGLICRGDARSFAGRFDAAVVDLPYGRASHRTEHLYEEILGNLRGLVRRAVVLTAEPLAEPVRAGWELLRLARVYCGQLVRHCHLMVPR